MDESNLGGSVIKRIALPLGVLAMWPTFPGFVLAVIAYFLIPRLSLLLESTTSTEKRLGVERETALLAELVSAHLMAGASLLEALQAASTTLTSQLAGLTQEVVHRLRTGDRDPFAPWRQVPTLVGLADSCTRSLRTGASISMSASRTAQRMREREFHQRQAALERAVIRMTLPMGLCLLPAFIATVVIPMAFALFQGISF